MKILVLLCICIASVFSYPSEIAQKNEQNPINVEIQGIRKPAPLRSLEPLTDEENLSVENNEQLNTAASAWGGYGRSWGGYGGYGGYGRGGWGRGYGGYGNYGWGRPYGYSWGRYY